MSTPEPPFSLSVFVIDDNESIRESLRTSLELLGIEVEVFSSPEVFLRGYRPRSRGCLLLDQQLGDSTGLDFIRSAEWRALGLPTILMPGSGSKELHLQAMGAGAAGYLEKPFEWPSLMATIYDAVRPVHNRSEINGDHLNDPAPASQVVSTLKSRSLSQRLERTKTPIRQLIQFLRRRTERLREVTRSHQSGVSDQVVIRSDEFGARSESLQKEHATTSVPGATPVTGASSIDAPHDGDLRALYQRWNAARGSRVIPQFADLEPTEIRNLLPYLILYSVLPGEGGYRVHMIGEAITQFVGQDLGGQLAGSFMRPGAADMINKILDAVAKERVPKFRAGKAHWHPEKTFRDFEACFLPLSSDGETADLILGGIKTEP